MARFLHCGDIHLGFRQYKREERYVDFAMAFRHLAQHALGEKVDFVLVAGDLFDKKTIDAGTLIQAKEVLEPLRAAGIPVVVIEGNHDRKHMREMSSWLEFLNYDGYIILLTHQHDEDGRVILREWRKDELEEFAPTGNYVVIGDTIIFGLGYPGASAAPLIERYAETLGKNRELLENKSTVLALHGGLEGYLDKMGGAIDYNAFLPLREYINYIALGHIHLMYVREGWIFNPGSLETWSVSEVGKERGFFDVTLVDGVTGSRFMEGRNWRRPFYTTTVSFQGISSYEEALSHLTRELKRWYGRIRGFSSQVREDDIPQEPPGPEEPPSARKEERETPAAQKIERTRDRFPEPGLLTLDAFTSAEVEEEEEEPVGKDDTESGITDGPEEIEQSSLEHKSTEPSSPEPTLKPVIQLTLEGIIGFNPLDFQKSDIEGIVREVTNPLHVLIKNNTYSHTVSPDIMLDREREVLEREVIVELIGQTREYRPVARELGELVIELKRDLLHRSDVEGMVAELARKRKELFDKAASDE